MIKNLNIGARLGASFGLMLLVLVGLVSFALMTMQSMSDRTQFLINDRYKRVVAIEELEMSALRSHRLMRDALLAVDIDIDDARKQVARIETARAEEERLLEQMAKEMVKPAAKKLLDEVRAARDADVAGQKEFLALALDGKQIEAKSLLQTKVNAVQNHYVEALSGLRKLQSSVMSADAAQTMTDFFAARNWLGGVTVLALALAAFAAWRISRGIVRPIREAVEATRRVAGGDLTGRIDVHGTDETGDLLRALQEMQSALVRIVADVRHGTEAITVASREIASGNMDLSSRTEQQASSLEETASSMEELTSTVKQNSDNARQANQMAITASEIATRGGSVVSQVVETMGAINTSARKIEDIISVIDGIAFQTNILALNAAVEAARAGEQGRGFAVVATEVRSLAQRSAAAAKEIKGLIGDSVGKVDAGTKLVDQAGATMSEVVDSVRRVADIIGEIAAAGQEQSAGIEQVNIAISQMDQVTQQNAALVEQAAAAAGSMQDQASQLVQTVAQFRLDGGAAARMPAKQVTSSSSLTTTGQPARKQLAQSDRPAIATSAGSPTRKPAALPASGERARSTPALANIPKRPMGSGADEDWEEF